MLLSEKLQLLRQNMANQGVHACIISSNDPHLSEYPANHWKIREWISGFTGSAGTLVITENQAGLWTDSRYHIQASEQLDNNLIQLFKEGLPEVPEIPKWLSQNLKSGQTVGINNALFSDSFTMELTDKLKVNNINTVRNFIAPEEIWEMRPPLPNDIITDISEDLSGFSRIGKLNLVREEMKKTGINYYISAALDEIAWVLNLRGTDVKYNPVFYAYFIISLDEAWLFVNPEKLSKKISHKLSNDKITILQYDFFNIFLEKLPLGAAVLADSKRTNAAIIENVSKIYKIKKEDSIITNLKAIKNETEIKNIYKTMIKDGVAMVNFLCWLYKNIEKEEITELSASKKLLEFRKEQSDFLGESFETISAYKEHGAIVHYAVNQDTDMSLKKEGIYLTVSTATQ